MPPGVQMLYCPCMDIERQRRQALLAPAKRLVVKVGSAVLTNPKGLDLAAVKRLSAGLCVLHDQGRDIVLVTSGAVATGRRHMREHHQGAGRLELKDLPGRQAASAIGQSRLMHEYDKAFARRGKVTAQVLLTRDDLASRERFLNARNTLERLLSWRVIPIINENDTVAVQELKFGDNDTLASLTVDLVGADLFVNLTSADCVFDKNPEWHKDARRLTCIGNISGLDIERTCEGKTAAGSGGMFSKLRAARRAAQLGVPTLIVSGLSGPALSDVLAGEPAGTLVLPEQKTVSHRKFWLAYHADPEGSLYVDAGAAKALSERGKSLLPAGIRRVEGEFAAGALVRIKVADGTTIGVGLSNYSAADLERIRGRKTSEIENILGADGIEGHAPYAEAVHRDNLLLDPAI